MGVVANWADSVRHYMPWSGSLHFIDVRDDLVEGGCHYQPNVSSTTNLCEFQYYHRDCTDGFCVAGAILNYSTQLIERPQPDTGTVSTMPRYLRQGKQVDGRLHPSTTSDSNTKNVRDALMFLIHFVGDIHQPLHVSRASDKGGNDITVKYHLGEENIASKEDVGNTQKIEEGSHSHHHSYNLHSVWDSAMIKTTLERDFSADSESHARSRMEDALESSLGNHKDWIEKFTSCQHGSGARHLECVIEWGQESWSYALKYAYTKNSPWKHTEESGHGSDAVVEEFEAGDEIDESYYSSRIPVVKEQLMAGGVRLAATLEDIFGRKSEDIAGVVGTKRLTTIAKASRMENLRQWSYLSHLRT